MKRTQKKGSEKELEIICRKAVGAFFFVTTYLLYHESTSNK